MSSEEWTFVENFILSIRTPTGRKAANHSLDLGGVFWIVRPGETCHVRWANGQQHRNLCSSSGSGRKRGTRRQGLGRSRSGFTTKIHLRGNAAEQPITTEITPGEKSEYLGPDLVMAENLPPTRRHFGPAGAMALTLFANRPTSVTCLLR